MKLTPEQDTILEAVGAGDDVMVEALAGCAKSTTIVASLSKIPASESTCVLAFNKKIKDEMESKVKEEGLARANLRILTLNGLGHAAIQRGLGRRLSVDQDKIFGLCKDEQLRGDDMADVMALIRAARVAGIVPQGTLGKPLLEDNEENWMGLCSDLDIEPMWIPLARKLLAKSNKLALSGTIDFDDQIYISTLIFGSFDKFDVVYVDEAQDLSRMNHEELRKAARGQLIAVGDPHQAIYAWRGADSDSMANLRALRPSWTDCTLSTTFRCSRAVVERQKAFVPRFQAGPNNLPGSVELLQEWSPSGGAGTAIICRNNAPLIKLAFNLLRSRIPINFLGKDIGRDMRRLYNKLSVKGQLSIKQVKDQLSSRLEDEEDKHHDRYASLAAILEEYDDVDEALAFLKDSKKNAITLSTGHKCKGLEWDHVYHYNPHLIPSKYAQAMGGSALQQERNLRYVIETRTRDKLSFVTTEGLQL